MKIKATVHGTGNHSVQPVEIHTETIRLDDFLKFCSAVQSGGEAKIAVQSGQVTVDGAVCTVRGKKLTAGQTVAFSGKTYEVCLCR